MLTKNNQTWRCPVRILEQRHDVYFLGEHGGNGPEVTVKFIGQHDTLLAKAMHQLTEQGRFPRLLALVRSQGHVA